VLLCRRRGAAIDLVLDRPRQARSQFVLTQVKGREAIFWQTQKTVRSANPGARIPRRRALPDPMTITVDTRERYPYRFARQGAETVRATVTAGDYAVHTPDGRSSPPLSARASTTSPRRSPTGPSPSNSNGWPSSHAPRSSSRPDTGRCSSSNTSTATGSLISSPASTSLPRNPDHLRRQPTTRRRLDLPVPHRRTRRHSRPQRHARMNEPTASPRGGRKTATHSFRPLHGRAGERGSVLLPGSSTTSSGPRSRKNMHWIPPG
jgi:hypothetical protein